MKIGQSVYINCLLLFLSITSLQAQNVYKTPSGKKYHLASCSMVENVSRKLVGQKDVKLSSLTPCKICNPPAKQDLVVSHNSNNKAVGESVSVRCNGLTKKRTRCKHKTKLANGYCYQHTAQNSSSNPPKLIQKRQKSTSSSTCGARTKAGGSCKRKVKNGGRCYQH